MKELIFDTSKTKKIDLRDLKAGSITIKEIEAENYDLLKKSFIIKTINNDQEFLKRLYIGAFINAFSENPKAELDYKIEDSDNSTIEVENDINTKYVIKYETLEDKIKNLKIKEKEAAVDYKRETDNYKQALIELYNNIIEWIEPLKGDISVLKEKITLNEEVAGIYEVDQLILKLFNNKVIVFSPKGRFIIGGEGRIDINMSGQFQNSLMLILKNLTHKKFWFLIINRDIQNKKQFNKAQLYNLIENAIEKKTGRI